MNLTLNHWIRFVGVGTTVSLVTCTIFGVSDWYEMIAHFALGIAGAVVGHWLATHEEEGD
jgi:uncharacterized membrane protein YeaQ/YmgE (transglycosylase-associated protein family)